MHVATFLQDLALIMIVAGIVTIIFHRLKQPVVLGYIIAGIILGPHTPPFSLIHDENIIKLMAELGVIFLMFSLGLEFSIRKLFKVGNAALIAALAEITCMIFIGYEIGQFFKWNPIDSLFLGAMLAISSTTIIIKALNELGLKKESFAQLIYGILIIEDILAIGMLVLLSSIAVSGSIVTIDIVTTLGKLLVFLVVALVLGILIVPKLLSYVAAFHSKEMLFITILAITFGFCLLVMRFDYSVALGAFIIGAIMAEAREIKLIEKLVAPTTDMFSAIFFVSIGLLVDPKVIVTYIVPITIITIAVVIGKVIMCSLGVFLAGRDGRTSLRVGMGLAQIGEFSFIIAALGLSLKVTSNFLYPVIVAVSAITTLLTPYLIKFADPLYEYLAKVTPAPISRVFNGYTTCVQAIQNRGSKNLFIKIVKQIFLKVFVNLILVMGIFISASYLSKRVGNQFFSYTTQKTLFWCAALILSLPFLIAIYRTLKSLSMLFAEITIKSNLRGEYNVALRRIVTEVICIISMIGIMTLVIALSVNILPPLEILILVITIPITLAVLFYPWFIKIHARFQIMFMDRFQESKKKD